ncbi:MAG TPA: peptidylprolyl isomerase [Thermoanaerobaculia bacterium]
MKNLICAALAIAVFACAPANNTNTASDTAATSATAVTATNTTTAPTTGAAPNTATMPKAGDEAKPAGYYDNKIAELHTTAGEIDIRFFPDKAPNHVKNFIDLSEKGFYNGTKFHRVIPGFMIQGGDPNTISGDTSTWGAGGSGRNVNAEFNNVHHARGIVSMARSDDPNSASSQFFICVADAPSLDGQYTVFGEVTKGMDVADKIVEAPRGERDRPNNPTTIEKVVIRDAKPGEGVGEKNK